MAEEDQGSLQPPPRTSIDDPGAHDLESSESEDHFSDAQSALGETSPSSAIPLTRVEKVDSEPSHGEVPGTEAYVKREKDATPDEVAVIPEDENWRAGSEGRPATRGDSSRSSDSRSRAASTPGDLPIPTTKVEKVDSKPSHGEVPGTDAFRMRRQDAEPDEVEEIVDAPGPRP